MRKTTKLIKTLIADIIEERWLELNFNLFSWFELGWGLRVGCLRHQQNSIDKCVIKLAWPQVLLPLLILHFSSPARIIARIHYARACVQRRLPLVENNQWKIVSSTCSFWRVCVCGDATICVSSSMKMFRGMSATLAPANGNIVSSLCITSNENSFVNFVFALRWKFSKKLICHFNCSSRFAVLYFCAFVPDVSALVRISYGPRNKNDKQKFNKLSSLWKFFKRACQPTDFITFYSYLVFVAH